jgi:hypothetical protein
MAAWIETLGIVVPSLTAIWGVVGWRKQMIAERKMTAEQRAAYITAVEVSTRMDRALGDALQGVEEAYSGLSDTLRRSLGRWRRGWPRRPSPRPGKS